jgi:maltose alpha-D-glucosyltransferase / alpha-amylase
LVDRPASQDRYGVPTPMPWNDGPQAGFSEHPAPYLPPVDHPQGGWRTVNVAAQEADPDSLLHWVRRLVRTRRSLRAIGAGRFALLDTGDDRLCVFAHDAGRGSHVVAVHNLAAETVTLDLRVARAGHWRRVLAGGSVGPDEASAAGDDGTRLPVRLEPYGYAWWSHVGGWTP